MKTFITKIKPEIDKAKLKQETNKLDKSFLKTAKNFSKAMNNSFHTLGKIGKFGFIAGAIAKLVNPLEEINETLNNTLNNFDQIGRLGEQLGIKDVAGLGALMTALQSKGLDRTQAEKILNELQTEIGKSRRGDETAKFSGLGAEENALTLFGKILDKISTTTDVNEAKAIASSVFGEKEASRLFDALRNREAFSKTYQEAYTRLQDADIVGIHNLQGEKDRLKSLQDLDIQIERAKKINEDVIKKQLESIKRKEDLKTQQIGQYEASIKTAELLDELNSKTQKGVNILADLFSAILNWKKSADTEKTKFFKNYFKLGNDK